MDRVIGPSGTPERTHTSAGDEQTAALLTINQEYFMFMRQNVSFPVVKQPTGFPPLKGKHLNYLPEQLGFVCLKKQTAVPLADVV